jgi:hypothetical protein
VENQPYSFSYRNLVYLFPGAAWVSQTFELFKTTSSIYSIYLALIFFAFIPVEVYATSLWAREKANFVGQTRTFIATAVDTMGVFFLSLLYVAYATLNSMHDGKADESQVRLIFIGLGMLLFLNGLWNALQRPADQDVFLSAQELASRKAELADDRPAKHWYTAVSNFMPILRVLNFALFGILSPLIGCSLLIGTSSLNWARLGATGESAILSSQLVVAYLSVLTAWKLAHTYVLTLMSKQVDDSTPRGTGIMIEVHGFQLAVIDIGDSAARRASKFRYECMTEDMIHDAKPGGRTSHRSATRYFERTAIATDQWDNSAVHIVVRDRGDIVGAIRVSFARTKRLPILENLSADSKKRLNIDGCDAEISRLFVKRAYRRTYVTAALLYAAILNLRMGKGCRKKG